MKTKHTPGPWTVAERKQEIRGNAWRLVLEINGPHTEPITDLYGAESRANAHLIAAAPEMLEALEKIKETLEILKTGSSFSMNYELLLINRAIAKARGHK